MNTDALRILAGLNFCGPLALRYVARRLGIRARFGEIARFAGTDRNGTTLAGLSRAASRLGLRPSMLRTNYAGLRTLPKPLIVHMREGHYEVLQQCGEHFVATGGLVRRRRNTCSFMREWSGVALVLQHPEISTMEG
jgi:ATP-binding cassette subfamily B protein